MFCTKLLSLHLKLWCSHSESTDGPMGGLPTECLTGLVSVQMLLKCADIGHLAADVSTHKRWAYQLEEEFFRQVSNPSSPACLQSTCMCHMMRWCCAFLSKCCLCRKMQKHVPTGWQAFK